MSMSSYEVGPVVAVSDLDRARRFYEEKLGLSATDENEGGVRYECGAGTGLFVYPSPEHAGQSTATLVGWVVDDIDKVVDELTSKGVTFEQYEGDLQTDARGIFEAEGMKAAWFRDPDGNTHALNQS
jgi:catechol 2,3-dioxygenase-like lactoylglutathione lyase family enzyme